MIIKIDNSTKRIKFWLPNFLSKYAVSTMFSKNNKLPNKYGLEKAIIKKLVRLCMKQKRKLKQKIVISINTGDDYSIEINI